MLYLCTVKLHLTAVEREIILHWNDEDRSWSLYCESRVLGGKLRKWLAVLRIPLMQRPQGHGVEAESIPRWAIEFKGKRRIGKPLTEAQKVRSRERFAQARRTQNHKDQRRPFNARIDPGKGLEGPDGPVSETQEPKE